MVEQHSLPEKTLARNYPNLRFEPGDHGANADFLHLPPPSPILDRFTPGDPNAHQWNSELVTRVEQTQPKIVAIDGLEFGEEFNDDGPKFIAPSSESAWLGLPTTPGKINPAEKSVFVVAGDSFLLGEAFNAPVKVNPELQALRKALNDKIIADHGNITNDLTSETNALLVTAGLIDLAVGGNVAYKKIAKKETVLSRRNFLKVGAAAAGTVAAHYYGVERFKAPRRAASSTTEGEKDKWMKVVDVVDPEIIKSKLLNMRTALLILKTKDSMDRIGLPHNTASSIIMGSAHSFDVDDFLDSDKKAQKAISDYLDAIDPFLTKALQDHPGISRAEADKRIKAQLSKTFVLQMKEPDHKSFGTPKLRGAVEKATSTILEFSSPRVETAFTRS